MAKRASHAECPTQRLQLTGGPGKRARSRSTQPIDARARMVPAIPCDCVTLRRLPRFNVCREHVRPGPLLRQPVLASDGGGL